MDRPIVIIVADSFDSLIRFEPDTLGADLVIITRPKHQEQRESWGHAPVLYGSAGAVNRDGVSVGWAGVDKIEQLLKALWAPNKLVVPLEPIPPELMAFVETQAMCLPIGRGIYRVELGSRPSGEQVARLVHSRELEAAKPWRPETRERERTPEGAEPAAEEPEAEE